MYLNDTSLTFVVDCIIMIQSNEQYQQLCTTKDEVMRVQVESEDPLKVECRVMR